MQDMLLQLTKRMESVDSQLQTLSTQPPNDSKPASIQEEPDNGGGSTDSRATEEINKAYLSALSVKEVRMR